MYKLNQKKQRSDDATTVCKMDKIRKQLPSRSRAKERSLLVDLSNTNGNKRHAETPR